MNRSPKPSDRLHRSLQAAPRRSGRDGLEAEHTVRNTDYELIDAGNGRKLERFGGVLLERPCSAAIWQPTLPAKAWTGADASFSRDGKCRWTYRRQVPATWPVTVGTLRFHVKPTAFGHMGVFPEHRFCWDWLKARLLEGQGQKRAAAVASVLNLFGYSGGASLAAAQTGASVCHVDASRGVTEQARANAVLNGLGDAPIRYIVEDVNAFLRREQRRKHTYDGIVLDPPSYGRGRKGEVFKIDHHLLDILWLCRPLLSPTAKFLLVTCHTPGYTPLTLHNVLSQIMQGWAGSIESGELVLAGPNTAYPIPSGVYAGWSADPPRA